MALDIKICGLRTPEAIAAATERGATHVGFVHFPPSPRHLTIGEMAALRGAVAAPVRLVVVLVDPDDATLAEIAERVRPDMVQLHGRETPERVGEVKRRTGLAVIKALPVGTGADLDAVALYRDVADLVLLDAKRPKHSPLPGGNGVAFDWSLLAALDPGVPYMLSGGITPHNVRHALDGASPAGLDVSSGVESAPGVKDLALIHVLFDALAASTPHQERKAS